eukprot:TRINITY_DN4784_c0_g1_i1.p1 TRINITY_DN4784_c0_g1~~TRINITY_DN4784_c0_g1_i1.p1  ORF type:complete len:2170 (+),score=703.41 TRINITY_DN4784_c0_g1_i1:46-6555(+)
MWGGGYPPAPPPAYGQPAMGAPGYGVPPQPWAQPQAQQQGYPQQGYGMPGYGGAPPGGYMPQMPMGQQMQGMQRQQHQQPQQQSRQRPAGEDRYCAFTEGNDAGEFVIQTLTGEFLVKGENHGRPYFQKTPARQGQAPPEVYIYFWDARDGPSFEGWWFGKAVGGNEVWSHCADASMQPPMRGWKIPFQGPERKTFCLIPKSEKIRRENAEKQGKLKIIESDCEKMIVEVQKAAEEACRACGGDADSLDAAKLKAAEAALAPQLQAVADQIRQLESSNYGDAVRPIVTKLRKAQAMATQEAGKIKVQMPKVLKMQEEKQMEARDDKLLKSMLESVTEKFNNAEDLVEKAEIMSATIEHAGEDLAEAQKAAMSTETGAKQAQIAVKDALAAIGLKLAMLKNFESDNGRLKATDALGAFREKLRVANQKLLPLLSAQMDFKQRAEAKKLEDELLAHVTPVEVEVDKAEEVAEPLLTFAEAAYAAGQAAAEATATPKAKPGPPQAGLTTALYTKPSAPKAAAPGASKAAKPEPVQAPKEPPTAEVIEMALKHATTAAANVVQVNKVLEAKRNLHNILFTPPLKKVLEKAEERMRVAQKKIDKIKAAQKEIQERETSTSLVKDVDEKMKLVDDAVKVAKDACSALSKSKMFPDNKKGSATEVDEALKAASKAANTAKIAISMKLLEVKRFTAEAGIEAQKNLTEHQKKLQANLETIDSLKKSAIGQKQTAKRKEAIQKVEEAERLAQQTEEGAECISDESKLEGMSDSEIREAGAENRKCYKDTNKAVADAQQMITALQIEAKGTANAAQAAVEFSKLQGRLRAAEAKVARFATLPEPVEKQLLVQAGIDEVEVKVAAAETKVATAEQLAVEAEENPVPVLPEVPMISPTEAATPKGAPSSSPYAATAKSAPKMAPKAAPKATPKAPGQLALTGPASEQPIEKAKAAIDAADTQIKVSQRFLEAHTRLGKIPEEEAEAMKTRLEGLKALLEQAKATTEKGVEKRAVLTLLGDGDKKVQEAEEAVEAAANMAEPLHELMNSEDANSPVKKKEKEEKEEMKEEVKQEDEEKAVKEEITEEAAPSPLEEGLAAMHAAAQAASKLLSNVKTSLAVKRISAKRLPGNASEAAQEQLDALQKRMDAAMKRLAEVRRDSTDRQYAKAKKAMLVNMQNAEDKVSSAEEAFKALMDLNEDAEAVDMQSVLQKAASAQKEAHAAIAAARSPLTERLAEAKAEGVSVDSSEVLKEFQEMLTKLSPLQTGLDEQKKQANEREHKFVAKCLLQEASDMFEVLDQKLKRMNDAAAPLVADKGQDLLLQARLGHILEALRRHVSATSKTPEGLFEEMATATGGEDKIIPSGAATALRSLKPELEELPDIVGTTAEDEKCLKAAFARLDPQNAENEIDSVTKESFLEELQRRYLCVGVVSITDALQVDGSKTVRKVDVGEVLQALGETEKEEKSGLTRVKVKAQRDEAEGYVSLAGQSGNTFLEVYTPFLACVRTAEEALAEVSESVTQTIAYLKQKNDELKNARATTPLTEVKTELTKLRVRASRAQASHSDVKRKVSDARKLHDVQLEAQRKRRQDAADKAAADVMTGNTTTMVEELTTQANAACSAAGDALSSDDSTSTAKLLQVLKEAEDGLTAVIDAATKGQDKIMKIVTEDIKNATKGPLVEARRVMFRLKVKLAPLPANCKKKLAEVQARKQDATQGAQQTVSAALRQSVKSADLTADTLYAQLKKGVGEGASSLPTSCLRTFLETGERNLSGELLDAAFHGFEDVITRFGFRELVQEYRRCAKEVALTPAFEVKGATATRKLEVGEFVEVVGESRKDDTTGLKRSECQALRDSVEGWVTVHGSQGTVFLERVSKPYFVCKADGSLKESCASSSKEVRKLCRGEILEVLEGPREEKSVEVTKARGKAPKDGKVGLVLFKDEAGETFFERRKLLVCKGSVALTDAFDISSCSAIRKLEVGETLEPLEEPVEDEKRKLLRMKVKAVNDGKEGWVTSRGNQGTNYVEDSDRHYVCTKSAVLESAPGKVVRTIEVGEHFDLFQKPTVELRKGQLMARGRGFDDTSPGEGWFAVNDAVQPFELRQQCLGATQMREGSGDGSQVVRELQVGEEIEIREVLQGSDSDSPGDCLRLKVRAARDEQEGVVSFLDADGKALFSTINKAAAKA